MTKFNLSTFKSKLEKQNVMHGNRYIFEITSPPNALVSDLSTEINGSFNIFDFRETIVFRAEQVLLPGMILSSADGIPPRFGYGAVEGYPYGIVHEDINVVFGLDDKGIVHKFFYEWLDLVVGHKAFGQRDRDLQRVGGPNTSEAKAAYEVEYKDKYTADINIYVLGPEQVDEDYRNDHVLNVKLFRAFPKNIPSLNLSYAEKNEYLRFPVQFNYTDFAINYKKINKTNILQN